MAKQHVNLRVSTHLINQLIQRGSTPQQQIERELSRYYSLLAHARQEIKARFTEQELNFIAEVLQPLKDEFINQPSMLSLPIILSEKVKHLEVKKYSYIDFDLLKHKVENLSVLCVYALVDLLEVYWRADCEPFQLADNTNRTNQTNQANQKKTLVNFL